MTGQPESITGDWQVRVGEIYEAACLGDARDLCVETVDEPGNTTLQWLLGKTLVFRPSIELFVAEIKDLLNLFKQGLLKGASFFELLALFKREERLSEKDTRACSQLLQLGLALGLVGLNQLPPGKGIICFTVSSTSLWSSEPTQ